MVVVGVDVVAVVTGVDANMVAIHRHSSSCRRGSRRHRFGTADRGHAGVRDLLLLDRRRH